MRACVNNAEGLYHARHHVVWKIAPALEMHATYFDIFRPIEEGAPDQTERDRNKGAAHN